MCSEDTGCSILLLCSDIQVYEVYDLYSLCILMEDRRYYSVQVNFISTRFCTCVRLEIEWV